MKKRSASKAKKTMILGEIRIPMHSIDRIEMRRDAPQFDPHREEAGLPAFRVDPGKMIIIVDMKRVEEPIQFTEYFRTRQKPTRN